MTSDRPCEATRELAKRWCEALRELAVQAHDNDVLLLLEGYADGVVSKDEAMEELGLTGRRYRNARNRLASYVDRLRREWNVDGGACRDQNGISGSDAG